MGLVIAAENLLPSLCKADPEALQCTSPFSFPGDWGPAECAGVESGECCALPPSLPFSGQLQGQILSAKGKGGLGVSGYVGFTAALFRPQTPERDPMVAR